MADNAFVFLVRARQEARYVDKGDDRDIEGIAEADKAGCFVRRIDIEAASQEFRLVGNDPYGLAVETGKAGDHVEGIVFKNLIDIAVIDAGTQDVEHVVCSRIAVRHDGIEAFVCPVRTI